MLLIVLSFSGSIPLIFHLFILIILNKKSAPQLSSVCSIIKKFKEVKRLIRGPRTIFRFSTIKKRTIIIMEDSSQKTQLHFQLLISLTTSLSVLNENPQRERLPQRLISHPNFLFYTYLEADVVVYNEFLCRFLCVY